MDGVCENDPRPAAEPLGDRLDVRHCPSLYVDLLMYGRTLLRDRPSLGSCVEMDLAICRQRSSS